MRIPRVFVLAAALWVMAAAGTSLAAKNVTMAVVSTFTTLDPYDTNDTLLQAIAKSFYEGLFGFDKEMRLVPVLAKSYGVDHRNMVYTIKLKKGVKFHDGTGLTAAAVKENFDRASNPENKLKRYDLYKNISKTEVVDDYTVRFTLKEPDSTFVRHLAHPSGAIISETALKKYGKEIMFHPVGTGPFKLTEWKQGEYLKVEKFDGYWKSGYPKVDAILWRSVEDGNTRIAMMRTGEAQFMFPVPYETVDALKSYSQLKVVTAQSIMGWYMSMNVQQKPFDNLKVREAINCAIDRDALIKEVFHGFAVPAVGMTPPGVDYSLQFAPWKQDLTKARKLLAEAGYPNGFETELWAANDYTTAQEIVQFLHKQLLQIGIKAKVTVLNDEQRIARVENYQEPKTAPVRLYSTNWSSSTGDADWALSPLLASDSWPPRLVNTAYYKNDRVDAELKKAVSTADPKEKARLYKNVQEQLWKDMPWAPLVVEKLLYAKNKKLKGVYVMPDDSLHFTEIELAP